MNQQVHQKEVSSQVSEPECPVCLDDFDTEKQKPMMHDIYCQTEFCAECVLGLQNRSADKFPCPFCQKLVNAADFRTARRLYEQVSKLAKLKKSSSNSRNALEALSEIDQSEIDQEMEIDHQPTEHPQCFLTCRESGEVKTV
jgi:hypothetical protein